VARALGSGAAGFRLTGPSERGSVLTRLDLAERLRSATGRFVEVDGPAQLRDDLAAGLVSGRADRVTITEEDA
jgi:anthraniloyl-CoA monooxygenase